MLSKDALQYLNEQAIAALHTAKVDKTFIPTILHPQNFEVSSLENYQEFRSRYRAYFSTYIISSFESYCEKWLPPACFINPDNMSARAIIDIGDAGHPGHCVHAASFTMRETAPFRAWEKFVVSSMTQRELAEFLEEWREFVGVLEWDPDAGEYIKMSTSVAISKIRQVTIESYRSKESVEKNFSSEQSEMQKIEAKSKDGSLPEFITFTCHPYLGLPEMQFTGRIAIITRNGDLSFKVRWVREEEDEESMAQAFVDAISDKLPENTDIYLGSIDI